MKESEEECIHVRPKLVHSQKNMVQSKIRHKKRFHTCLKESDEESFEDSIMKGQGEPVEVLVDDIGHTDAPYHGIDQDEKKDLEEVESIAKLTNVDQVKLIREVKNECTENIKEKNQQNKRKKDEDPVNITQSLSSTIMETENSSDTFYDCLDEMNECVERVLMKQEK